jgi:glycogen debranching enzyme
MAQPYLHGHLTCVAAPATWLSGPSGQLVDGADGLYVNDRRILSRLVVTVDGVSPEPLSARNDGASAADFHGVLRMLGDPGPDPTVTMHRRRRVEPSGGTETLRLVNRARAAITATVAVEAAADFAPMGLVKDGRPVPVVPFDGAGGRAGGRAGWRAGDGATASVDASPAPDSSPGGRLQWRVSVPARSSWTATLRFTRTDVAVSAVTVHSALTVTADDRRLDELVRQSVADLDALRMPDGPDMYYAAGSPWYLTLFGRDSLWTARLALPLGWETALGTVRALARRQGVRVDPDTEEAPGKILHEVRPPDAATWLPPVYYGSVDATALFVTTVAEAYRWGAPATDIVPLLSNVERALAWLTGHRGFVTYRPTGHGLANQAWKDSGDGVQYADGRIATAPLSLSEVQGYAYQAALDGAWLVESLGDGKPAAGWRAWAEALRARFRARYWCTGTHPPYPAIALDAGGGRVDGPASNMGHLLGTGILDAGGAGAVTAWLTGPELAAPYGLRTLATSATGYNPISYHAGSVWPHDTVIAVLGLVREGQPAAAARHIGALLAAADRFGFRLPELFGGDDVPTPYPPSCRPQAWAAAVGPAVVTALLGLRVDAPAGRLCLDPIAPSPVGAYRVRGLRVAGDVLDVDVDASGTATVLKSPCAQIDSPRGLYDRPVRGAS